MPDAFASSDSIRSARPLRHAKTVHFTGPIELTRGQTLPAIDVCYETYGRLNAERSNAIYVCHALSGDSHVTRHDAADDAGWWELMVGPGRPVDTDKYFVICANILGGCRGTTGPTSINPATGRPYGPTFPDVTVEDMVDVQRMLIDHLAIPRLHAVIGGSLGGHQVLCWATRYPDRVLAAAALATSARLTSQALAFDVVARNAIIRDPHFHNGHYYDQPTRPSTGLALARMLGHITYLSQTAMADKFDHDKLSPRDIATEFEKVFSVGSYLAYQGEKFVERFDANTYITLSAAMDHFDLGATPTELRETLGRSECRWLVLSFTSDWLFPPVQSRQIVNALIAADKYVSYCNVTSDAGHDAFLLEDDFDRYGEMVRAFLDTTNPQRTYAPLVQEPRVATVDALHNHRIDYSLITDLVEPGASVLDLGCGNGQLLSHLAQLRSARRLLGIEVDEHNILATMRRGFDVLQSDLEEGLPDFADRAFDCVVLSQTLQSIVNTEAIIDEILRVGRRCIVSFPNFAYHKIRTMLHEQGRSPASERGLLHYAWFNTPNRRFFSILDFEQFCAERGIAIHTRRYLDTEADIEITDDPNLHADLAIFTISR